MTNKAIPALGEKVSFVKVRIDGETNQNVFERNEGVVIAYFLNADKRQMVNVKVGESVVSVDLACINPSDEDVAQYEGMVATVDHLSVEGRDVVQKITDDYNERIQAVYTTFLGAPLHV